MKYKIAYQLPPSSEIHHRYYTALNRETAEYMFKETIEDGSLIGSKPLIVAVYKLFPPRWQQEDNQ